MTKIQETIADIAYLAGHYHYYSGNSRADMQNFVYLAEQFEKKHKKTDWETSPNDYMSEVEKFVIAELKLKPKLYLSYPEAFRNKWDNLEIQRCRSDEDSTFVVDDDDDVEPNDFWSVYAHSSKGGVMCVADVPTQEDAIALRDTITRAVKTFKDNGFMKMYDNKHLQQEIEKLLTEAIGDVHEMNAYHDRLKLLRNNITSLFI